MKQYKEFIGEDFSDAQAEQFIQTLESGGEAAVQALKDLKGSENVSSAEISAVYSAKINELRSAAEEVTKGVGEIISSSAAEILNGIAGFDLTDIGGGNYVINAVGDMVDVYISLYARMKSTAEHTTAELNDMYVQIMTAQDQ